MLSGIQHDTTYCIMIERSVHQEHNNSSRKLKVHVTSNRTSEYMLQIVIELQRELNKSTNLVGDFNTPSSVIDRTSKHNLGNI